MSQNGHSPFFPSIWDNKYLSDLISLRCSISLRLLRSSSTLQLTLGPRTITRFFFFFFFFYGDRAFSVIAPILWNKLPVHIHNTHSLDQFKTLLKTHLLIYKLYSTQAQLWVGQRRCTPSYSLYVWSHLHYYTCMIYWKKRKNRFIIYVFI